jgi:site-specific DNA-methyltransferase (adenine-specific)
MSDGQMSLPPRLKVGGRNPDVLTCIANLSNDEVFSPPDIASQMLDDLTASWARDNDGEDIWTNHSLRFLDPCTKSGVFLREITRRLSLGLAQRIPDLESRINHILTNQVFGLAITEVTALLVRRSVYCSKFANGDHSVFSNAKSPSGNIWFERLEHTWDGNRCSFCGCGRALFGDDNSRENHAYGFIHTEAPFEFCRQVFGENMQFDVIVGNPPYQIDSDGNTRSMPIYQKFVDAAIKLDPQYVLMITPSRWFAGGLGLDDFRRRMLTDGRISSLVDYPDAGNVFPGVEIKGGVSYFLWSSNHSGDAHIQTCREGAASIPMTRRLDEFDILVRENRAISIVRKVLAFNETPMSELISSQKPFGLLSNFSCYTLKQNHPSDVRYYGVHGGKRTEGWVARSKVTMNELSIKHNKVLLPEAGSDGGKSIQDSVIGTPWLVPGDSVCSQTFLFIPVADETAGQAIVKYLSTKFARFLISQRKISQHTKADTYRWLPQQDSSIDWTDSLLFEKYNLTPDEVQFIETMIRTVDFA